MLKKFPEFYGNRKFITLFTEAFQLTVHMEQQFEVEHNEGQIITKFISYVIALVSIKQHVSAYSEAIIRFTKR